MQETLLTCETKSLFSLRQEGEADLKRAGIPSARLESELLLCHLLSLKQIEFYLSPERVIPPEQCRRFEDAIKRRVEHEPLQYITGEVAFCDFSLIIRPGVFIPRPETELIVEAAKDFSPEPLKILDLCTGSGVLAIALARQFPAARVWATDISDDALSLAADNAERHQLASRITLSKGDLFEALKSDLNVFEGFDLIVCNPPYISEKDRPSLPPEVRDYEPEAALFAPDKGTAFYRRILLEAPQFMSGKGVLLFELGAGQSTWFQSFVQEKTNMEVRFTKDWAEIERIAQVSKRGAPDG